VRRLVARGLELGAVAVAHVRADLQQQPAGAVGEPARERGVDDRRVC
jgi:hypothetical protein